MTQSEEVYQHRLDELKIGSAGGRAIRDRNPPDYFKELGKKGGKVTSERYGIEYMHKIASNGATERRNRLYRNPRTVRPWYGGRERRIPYWPHNSTKRRNRPVMVCIELEEGI